ncbi:MAG: hypothetical protein HZB80_11405 [Deltaproteobacteria bacterium]|nr:hypothetical protein [Deltaproteobacteria bacterium]
MLLPLDKKIQLELIKKGIKAARIARKCGVSRWTTYAVMRGKIKALKYREAICEATGLPLSIWDEIDRDKKEA